MPLKDLNAVIRRTISCADSKVVECKTKCRTYSICSALCKLEYYNPCPYHSFCIYYIISLKKTAVNNYFKSSSDFSNASISFICLAFLSLVLSFLTLTELSELRLSSSTSESEAVVFSLEGASDDCVS